MSRSKMKRAMLLPHLLAYDAVCEQKIASSASLIDDLSARLDAMTSDESADLENQIDEWDDEIVKLVAAL